MSYISSPIFLNEFLKGVVRIILPPNVYILISKRYIQRRNRVGDRNNIACPWYEKIILDNPDKSSVLLSPEMQKEAEKSMTQFEKNSSGYC